MKLALVDGHNLAFRAFYGMPALTRGDGFPTGAVHGWVRTIWALEDQIEADRMLVFFDLGEPVRHTALAADYKGTRGETPEALTQQMPHIRAWTQAMGYGAIEEDGVEADDLIASCARREAVAGHAVTIVSADKDLGQLVDGTIRQLLPPPTANPKLGWRWLDVVAVEEKFGVPPHLIPDYLALVGDASDNIAGLSGVGPKTAAKWLRAFGSLDGVIAHSGDLTPKRFQAPVHAAQERLRVNLQMTTLDTTRKTPPLGEVATDFAKGLAILSDLEMRGSVEQAKQRYTAG